jgi:broad specificity phosphatase PhoE
MKQKIDVMEKEVWFIRHGESEANAGFATSSHAGISLTGSGYRQAIGLTRQIEQRPDLIILTSHVRTQQTAVPCISKFPDVPIETWPLHEFDYLSPVKCRNTTIVDRRPWANEFWARCEPDYIHGDGSESFAAFSARVINGIRNLERREEKFIIVFTHGQVIRAIRQYLDIGIEPLQMSFFRDKMLGLNVPNTSIFKARYGNGCWYPVPGLWV